MPAPEWAGLHEDFVMVDMRVVDVVGGYTEAGVFQRIYWKWVNNGPWHVTLTEMAEDMHMPVRTLQRALDRLKKLDWVSAVNTGRGLIVSVITDEVGQNGQPGTPDENSQNGQPGTPERPTRMAKMAEQDGQKCMSSMAKMANHTSYIETKENKREDTLLLSDADETVLATPDGSADIEPDADVVVVDEPRKTSPRPVQRVYAFDRFWAVYPRKVGKQAAGRAWVNAMKRTPAGGQRDGLADAIVAAAERMRDDPNLPDTQFIPHPATWLNRGGWEDEPYPPPPMPRSANGVSTTDARVAQGLALAEKYAAMDREEAKRITGGHHE